MKIVYKSIVYKICSVIRYLIMKISYRGRFQCTELSMIGNNVGLHIFKPGRLICRGRIIVDDDVMIYTKSHLEIGKNFGINRYSRIVAHDSITIGDNVTIGQMVSILDHDHHYEMKEKQLSLDGYDTAKITIGNNIWIGDKCTILKGVTIGDNVVIGAQTLVNKDVPSGSVIGGVPFKILKKLEI